MFENNIGITSPLGFPVFERHDENGGTTARGEASDSPGYDCDG